MPPMHVLYQRLLHHVLARFVRIQSPGLFFLLPALGLSGMHFVPRECMLRLARALRHMQRSGPPGLLKDWMQS